MKLCAISDLHGNLNFDIEECDILLICGDIVDLYIQNYMAFSEEWYEEYFVNWCNRQPCQKIYLIGGNHDAWLERCNEKAHQLLQEKTNGKIVYLCDEEALFIDKNNKEYKIYGTPWCHRFGRWSFMKSDSELQSTYEQMPENVDILLCHDCPYGVNDVLLQNVEWNTHEHIGCKPLRKVIELKSPKYVFTGHLHSVTHETVQLNTSKITNVSLLDENYRMVYEPFYLEI